MTANAVVEEELKVDDGTIELIENLRILAMLVNRLTPSRYPAKLQTVRLYFQNTNPAPSGEKIRLVVFAQPLNLPEPPHNPIFLINQEVTVPALISPGQFVDFPLRDGPTIYSGDYFVGFQAPYPYHTSAPLLIADLNNPASQERSYRSTGGINISGDLQFFSTPFSPLIRAVVEVPPSTTVTTVSAASYGQELASESIAAAFGVRLADSTAAAGTLPLPTQLADTMIKVKDSAGAERDAPLFFVSPNQINYQIPVGVSLGIAGVTVYRNGAIVASGTTPIIPVAPALFSANASGEGVPAALLLRVRGSELFYEPVARYDGQQFVPVEIDLGPVGDQVFLILFGTGFRSAGASSGARVTIGNAAAEVLYAGPAPGFAGLDQANVRIPRALIGKGEVSIAFTADNRSANAVTINIR